MIENSKPNIPSLESPASWNTRYQTPEGFVCQITLRADSGKELLDKAGAAIAHLLQTGCTPYETANFRPKNNGSKAQKTLSTTNQNQDMLVNSANQDRDGSNGNEQICPVHNMAMKRWERDGRVWYSHKHGDSWCNGK